MRIQKEQPDEHDYNVDTDDTKHHLDGVHGRHSQRHQTQRHQQVLPVEEPAY